MKKQDKELMKAAMRAPCGSADGGKLSYPSVDCDWNCDSCPWNPREKARRFAEGRTVNGMLIFKRREEIEICN